MRIFSILLLICASLSSCYRPNGFLTWSEGSCKKRICLYRGAISIKANTYNFKPDGTKIHLTTFIVNKRSGNEVYEKIYNQRQPNGEYKKIGNNGYVMRHHDFYAPLDPNANVPDGIVVTYFEANTTELRYGIYKNGKMEPYTGPVVQGYIP